MTQNLTRKTMTAPPKEILKKLFLFKGISDGAIDKMLPTIRIDIKDYAKGESIYTPEDFDKNEVKVLKEQAKNIIEPILEKYSILRRYIHIFRPMRIRQMLDALLKKSKELTVFWQNVRKIRSYL